MTLITYGALDLFHIGHLLLFERAKEFVCDGSKLIVAVSADRIKMEAL